jgi:hypothetical protein
MLDQRVDEHGKDAKIYSGSGRQSVIPYVHLSVVLLEKACEIVGPCESYGFVDLWEPVS